MDLLSKVKSASYSALEWAKAGFPVVSNEDFENRKSICNSCEFFEPKAFYGDGRCAKCGCDFKLKSKMATESCPIGKWNAVEPFNPNNK